MRITRGTRVMGRSGRRGTARLLAGALLGALSFVRPAAAGEAVDFTGPYVGFNLGYGIGGSRERGRAVTTPDAVGRDGIADPALPPSAAAAAKAMQSGRSAAGTTSIGR